ncbi:MAG: hypothetical protein AAFQ23_00465 [Cyanobacteria bacterium J06623_1]
MKKPISLSNIKKYSPKKYIIEKTLTINSVRKLSEKLLGENVNAEKIDYVTFFVGALVTLPFSPSVSGVGLFFLLLKIYNGVKIASY